MTHNYIRMIDYSRTMRIDPETTLLELTTWVNKQFADASKRVN